MCWLCSGVLRLRRPICATVPWTLPVGCSTWRRVLLARRAGRGQRNCSTVARQSAEMLAPAAGYITAIDNRLIARIAKLAGAPRQQRAGVRLLVRVGEPVETGQPLYEIHAETTGELAYARAYAEAHAGALSLSEDTA